ncbi:exopolysaccharide biosynthesis protein exod [Nibricoccus aquaticus]|uniref:Exopolysaccharide biosynthesis protein exod n=1 Tax=Nibricoccus aquaticus TaxID=2576891 RepID=A0A290QCI0_9BACT|nr:exopolysaccharide biosynthesis protein [Nibricoccus aquaticus]ATC63946.1 exopolysaccharide biosynthesis protein exod [Nibricoccus aquaticus]
MATNAAPEPEQPEGTGELPLESPRALTVYVARRRKLSEEMEALKARSAEGELTLREAIVVLGVRAYTLLLILLSLPFITPIPLPGLSTPFGVAVGLIALRLMLGQKPWLPEKVLNRPIPPGFFGKVFKFAAGVIRFLEKLLKPRLTFLTDTVILYRTHAALMLVAALALLLPLPIPFTNTFPAWTIILVAAGLLERDGLFILGGYLAFAAGVLYFVFLGEATQRALVWLKDWVVSWW